MNWLNEENDFASGAFLNFSKPVGKSSFWIVKKVRYLINTKVGHAGTLDPFAEGVLILCTGRATKKVSEIVALPKEYEGVISLGIQTETDDPTGRVMAEKNVPKLTEQRIRKTLEEFEGEILQIPPMFSAQKIGGERLYHLARQGKVVERQPKMVNIHSISLLDFDGQNIGIRVNCSKGTYIRALARDIGQNLGCGAHLAKLVRTKVGEYKLEDSMNLDEFNQLLNKIKK